ncbi:MAG: methylaspartate mutase accessory protein GlmL [Bacillota bacterium]
MKHALLIDIGSTYTKVALFNLDELELVARNQAYTTVEAGINQGLQKALSKIDDWEQADYKLACSSAAGGLKIAASGLVPDLTAEAARQAALGAGSRVVGSYAYELTASDMEEIKSLEPDIILLAGGTDGGNQKTIVHNARVLAASDLSQPIVVAGNRSAAAQVVGLLEQQDKEVYLTENVMPELEKLNIEPARRQIREIFLEQIVTARGFDQVKKFIKGVIMPTPAAVLQAADILSRGVEDEPGLGELIIADIGGATTDIHSAAAGTPQQAGVSLRGLEEPYLKRTVEGDLGMRYSAPALLELQSEYQWQERYRSLYAEDLDTARFQAYTARVGSQADYLPSDQSESRFDNLLGQEALRRALVRHAGRLKTIYTPRGQTFIQEGKDLTGIQTVIGTGGILVHNDNAVKIMAGVRQDDQLDPESLAPLAPEFYLDQDYLLAALGLLGEVEPRTALKLMKKYLIKLTQEDTLKDD